jgi:hypothetical protein
MADRSLQFTHSSSPVGVINGWRIGGQPEQKCEKADSVSKLSKVKAPTTPLNLALRTKKGAGKPTPLVDAKQGSLALAGLRAFTGQLDVDLSTAARQ